tara:strand:- start:657 stop:1337 length:681 start_codon:yes stop_codon:yes gene_type:complete
MKRPTLLILILISTFLLSYIYLQEIFNLDKLKENINFLKIWVNEEIYVSRISFFILYIIFSGLSFPLLPSILTIAAGALFGIVEGVIIVSFASTIGACICFLLSRYLLKDFINIKFEKTKLLIDNKFSKNGIYYLLSLRLIPTISFVLINLIMGVLPISLYRFYYISQIGMLPATVIYVNAGSEISKVSNINDVMSFSLIVSLLLLATLPLLMKFTINYFIKLKNL